MLTLFLENFTSLKKTACRIRIEEIEPMYGTPPAWRVIVFQKLSETVDLAVHKYEDKDGRFRSSLKDVLQRVFLQSCQEEAVL